MAAPVADESLQGIEQDAARLANLVLQATRLAERYATSAAGTARVEVLQASARAARAALARLCA